MQVKWLISRCQNGLVFPLDMDIAMPGFETFLMCRHTFGRIVVATSSDLSRSRLLLNPQHGFAKRFVFAQNCSDFDDCHGRRDICNATTKNPTSAECIRRVTRHGKYLA
jgi:hypothetical protein